MDDIEYWYGNPSIDVYKGELQVCQENTGKFCIIDIPTSLITQDICDFLKSKLLEIQEMRILRSSSNKFYYCAILLQPNSDTINFFQEFEGKKFNSIELNTCNIVNIKFWDFKNAEASPHTIKCPICLEEIDKVSISILCGHLFHVKCLDLWSDTTCPICRYHQTPPDSSVCDTCGEEQDIRMCLICGELGCNTHSTEHFASTGHTYYQEIETSKTWDYSRQVSISRLINSTDKIVEIQDTKKIDSLMFEYNCLLSSLLETQKEFYDQKIKDIEHETNPMQHQIEELRNENCELRRKADEGARFREELDEVNRKIVEEGNRKKELTEENERLSGFVQGKKVFKVTKEVMDEIKDLEMQIKEMKFYVETQKKLQGVDVDSIEIRRKK